MILSYLIFLIATLVALYSIYMLAFFVASLALGAHENHYVLGFGKPIFSFKLKNVKFSIAFFIPIFGLARIRAVVDRQLVRRRYPWQFVSVSISKRLIVTISGAVALILTGIIVYVIQTYNIPETSITKEAVNKTGVNPSVWARDVGFENQDQVTAINGKDYKGLLELNDITLWRDSATTFTVVRKGKQQTLRIGKFAEEFIQSRHPFLWLYVPFEVGSVVRGSPAEEAGLQTGDRIVKVNGWRIVTRSELISEFDKDVDKKVELLVLSKGNNKDTLRMNAVLNEQHRLGFAIHEIVDYSYYNNSPGEAIVKGTSQAFSEMLNGGKSSMRPLFGNETSTLPELIEASASFEAYVRGAASAALRYGVWNLLPLPFAVFWEIIPLLYERITRKKCAYEAFARGLRIGWVIMLALFVASLVMESLKIFS